MSFFDKFHIGAYCLGATARTEEHVRELAECGIDTLFAVNADSALLDLLYQYGVGAVVNGVVPGWFGADGKNAGTMHELNSIETYRERACAFRDHPAIVGIDIGDEPSALDLPHYGRVVELLKEHLGDKLLYLNLYPSYGMLASAGKEQATRELGRATYREYLTAYRDNVQLPYVSIDHYPYSSDFPTFLCDLGEASAVAKSCGRHLMVVLQVNSHDPTVCLSADQLRLQAWCAMAYGARSISWACYSPGWWHNCVLDKSGDKTEQYAKLKEVNQQLRHYVDASTGYTHRCAEILRAGDVLCCATCSLRADGDILVGRFSATDGREALLGVPLDPGKELTVTVNAEQNSAISVITDSEVRRVQGEKIDLTVKKPPVFIYSE